MTAQYLRIYQRHVLRYLAQHPLLALLNVLSVALGVAVFLATQIANSSANHAFAATIDVVAGKADLQITAPASGLPEMVLPEVSRHAGVTDATPLVRGLVTLPQFPGEYLEVLGIDLFTNEGFRTFEVADLAGGSFSLEDWLRWPDAVAISQEFANRHHLKTGDAMPAQVNGVEHQLRVAFVLQPQRGGISDEHFAAMDIGWAQELFGVRGRLSEVQLRLAKSADRESVVRALRQLVPSDAVVAAPVQRSEQVDKMLGGFELNLTAMSLVSVLVGMFLIYNAVSASVVRRRREIGILRALGTTRNEVRALFLSEAVGVGVVGTIVGIFGGLLLARVLVGIVAGTISSLYVLINITRVSVQPFTLVSAIAVGLGSVLLAAWLPAREASRMEPVRALGGGTMVENALRLSPAWLGSGLASIGLAALLSFCALTIGPPALGFGAAFFVLAGFSLVVPPVTAAFSRIFKAAVKGIRGVPVEARLANGNLSRALARNSVTIASLAAAVAMTVGVSVMVFSFRQTVESWINETLLADLFIAPTANEMIGPSSFIPPECIRFLQTHSDVAAVDTFREVDVPFHDAPITVAVVQGNERRRLQFVHGESATIMRRFERNQCVLVSESFARRQHLQDGEVLELPTPTGTQRFPIAGTFYDYTRDQGVVYLSSQQFIKFWHDDRINSIAVYLREDASAERLTAEFRARFSGKGEFAIYSNRSLRTKIFEIFDQTFAVTYVLRTIAVVVALVGVFLSLTTLIVGRTRELAVIRAVGGSAGQLRALLLWECAMIGLLAAAVGVLSGVALSSVLTGVINRAFFGWTIHLAFPWWSLLTTPTWIIAAAVIAGILPAWRAGKMRLSKSLREE